MRLNICEEEDFNNQGMFWEANQERSLKGRKGQAALRELEAALLALPNKRLIENELENEQGEVCAIGALAKFKGRENPRLGDSYGNDEDRLFLNQDEVEQVTIELAQELGVPRLVAMAVVYENDDYYSAITPEMRYRKVLGWVQGWLSGRQGWLTKKRVPALSTSE